MRTNETAAISTAANAAPEYFYSFESKRVVLLGETALDKAIAVHPYIKLLASMSKVEIGENSADGAIGLRHLVTESTPIPDDFRREKNRFTDLSREEMLNYGRWLTYLVGKGNVALNSKVINRAAFLGLGVSVPMLQKPERFGSVSNFQRELGQEQIRSYDYSLLDDWELAGTVRELGNELGSTPTSESFSEKARKDSRLPSYDTLRYHGWSLNEAKEMAGYLNPRLWDRNKFGEWGALFHLANGRLFTLYELGALAALGRGPSPTGSSLKFFGNVTGYQKFIRSYISARSAVKLRLIETDISLGDLPKSITAGISTDDELIRRAGRYKIIKDLFSQLDEKRYAGLSLYDVRGDDFIRYANSHGKNSHGKTRDKWMFESAAWKHAAIPDIFPDGQFIESLRLTSVRGTVF